MLKPFVRLSSFISKKENMYIRNLKDSVENFKSEMRKKEGKRELWVTSTKKILMDTLAKIKETYPLGWDVHEMDKAENTDGYIISFADTSIDIAGSDTENTKSYTKRGGTLAFTQAYNGDVFVIIVFPIIDELVLAKEPQKVVLRVTPNKITEEFIHMQVANFLDEMVQWESSSLYNDIGFDVKR